MYSTKFIASYTNAVGHLIEVYFDVLGYVGSSSPLILTDDGFSIRNTTGDQDKSNPICGTEALIKIAVRTIDQISIYDLIAQYDNSIRITAYMDKIYTSPIFQGFISVEDNSQPLQDPPFVLSVRALDGLGLLKGLNFEDVDGNLYAGRYSVINLLGELLWKTGQTMTMRVYFNLYEVSMKNNISPIEQMFLDVVTFQSSSGTPVGDTDPADFSTGFDDCYTVLEKIVRNLRCKLFQQNGKWHLVNLYEYFNPNGYTFYDFTFSLVDNMVLSNPFNKQVGQQLVSIVGKKQVLHPVQEDQSLYLKLATKSFELSYSYDQALNTICNQNLSQGVRDPSLDGTIPDETNHSIIRQYHAFTAYCYTHLNGTSSPGNDHPYPSSPPTKNAYIRSVIDGLGYELIRYLVIEQDPANPVSYLVSSPLDIDVNDVFQMSFSWMVRGSLSIGGFYVPAYVLLTGDDGTFWALFSNGNRTSPSNPDAWVKVDHNFQGLGPGFGTPPISSDIYEENGVWQSLTANQNNETQAARSPAVAPVSGQIQVLFVTCYGNSATPVETWFKDITIKILPFLAGGYVQIKGDYNYDNQNNSILQTFNETIQISDSPKTYFKGALLSGVGTAPLLTPNWHRDGIVESKRFTQLMTDILYTNFSRILQRIEGSFRGLTYQDTYDLGSSHVAGLLNSYVFEDGKTPTKRFMCTSFDIDFCSGIGRRVFVETLKGEGDLPLYVPDQYIFAYLFSNPL